MQDHKEIFFGTSKAFTGTLAPHITTEVDCESLFSQAGHTAHPNWGNIAYQGVIAHKTK